MKVNTISKSFALTLAISAFGFLLSALPGRAQGKMEFRWEGWDDSGSGSGHPTDLFHGGFTVAPTDVLPQNLNSFFASALSTLVLTSPFPAPTGDLFSQGTFEESRSGAPVVLPDMFAWDATGTYNLRIAVQQGLPNTNPDGVYRWGATIVQEYQVWPPYNLGSETGSFTYRPVPEPTTCALLALGALFLLSKKAISRR